MENSYSNKVEGNGIYTPKKGYMEDKMKNMKTNKVKGDAMYNQKTGYLEALEANPSAPMPPRAPMPSPACMPLPASMPSPALMHSPAPQRFRNSPLPSRPGAPPLFASASMPGIDKKNRFCSTSGDKQLNGEENHPDNVEHAEPYMDTGDRWDPIIFVIVDKPKPVDETPRCRSVLNWFTSLAMLVLLMLSIVFTINSHIYFVPMIVCWVLLGVFLIAYLIENFTSSTAKYLTNFVTLEQSERNISAIQNACPSFTFHIQCYHYETYTTTSRDSNGNTKTETHTRTVYTWSNSMLYHFDCWQDFTNLPNYEELHAVTKYRFHKSYGFADDYTQNHFQQIQNEFIRNNDRDMYHDFQLKYKVPFFVDRILVETQPGSSTDTWFSYDCFCCSVLGCFSACFRSWFLSNTGKQSIGVRKVIQKLSPPPQVLNSHDTSNKRNRKRKK